MRKNEYIADIEVVNNKFKRYIQIYQPEFLPIGTRGKNELQEQILLEHWQKSRCIPANRVNVSHLSNYYDSSILELFFKNAGISLTDMYWVQTTNHHFAWEDINFHDNGFESNILLSTHPEHSPDYTTDGIMEKYWYMAHNIPYLAKFDEENQHVLCANEVVAAQIATFLNISVTPYYYGEIQDKTFCTCPCFIHDSNSEFVSAMQLKHQDFSRTGMQLIHYLMHTLHFEKEMKDMIALDCLLHNVDRHEKNFGYIQTNHNKVFVPLFDNGYCLGMNRDQYHPVTDDDMKIIQGKGKNIIDYFQIKLDIDASFLLSILENVYELYHIPEYRYQMAKEELIFGMQLFSQKQYFLQDEYEIET